MGIGVNFRRRYTDLGFYLIRKVGISCKVGEKFKEDLWIWIFTRLGRCNRSVVSRWKWVLQTTLEEDLRISMLT
jgi:hypothetical protein